MTTEPRVDDKAALEQVIRAFSDAEVALQEIAGQAQRVKAAGQQLDVAKDVLESTNGAIAASADALTAIAVRLQESAGALATAAERSLALEPERLWSRLDELSAAAATAVIDRERALTVVRGQISQFSSQSDARADAMAQHMKRAAWISLSCCSSVLLPSPYPCG